MSWTRFVHVKAPSSCHVPRSVSARLLHGDGQELPCGIPRTDTFRIIRPRGKGFPGNSRKLSTVPADPGGSAIHGLTRVSSSQLRMTTCPGPHDMSDE